MKEETKKEFKEFITMGIIVILGIALIVGVFLGGVSYMMNITEQQRHDDLSNNLILNNSYEIINIDSDFVSGNECKYFVSIKIKNETNEITLNDFKNQKLLILQQCNHTMEGWYNYRTDFAKG